MADQNPTADPRVVPVDLPVSQTEILRSELNGWLAGIEEDLEAALRPPDRKAAIEEADAFGRLLVALHRGEIGVPDEAARSWLCRAAEGYDEANGYDRVVAVHDAHHALLSVLG
ncbi:MAG: hypothetical protein ACRDPE_00870 [Solirubrobacterales bacterium]